MNAVTFSPRLDNYGIGLEGFEIRSGRGNLIHPVCHRRHLLDFRYRNRRAISPRTLAFCETALMVLGRLTVNFSALQVSADKCPPGHYSVRPEL